MKSKIKSFTDLIVWRKAHTFILKIYRITKSFPVEERFNLTSQLRRAAVSITSNIAEGFSRRTPKDKANFYNNALGSLTEVQNQLLIVKDLGYIGEINEVVENSIEISKLLNGLIKATKTRMSNFLKA